MTHRIIEVKVIKEHTIFATFQNGVIKEYDMCQIFSTIPQFESLKSEPGLFEQVKVDVGGFGISWNEDLDLSAEEIWQNGLDVEQVYKVDIKNMVGAKMIEAREMVGMKQIELAKVTGIYQGDISKIERGIANPSILTLQRIANGMGMKLKIDFVK